MDVDPEYVLKFLSGVEYPATKDDLVRQATEQGGDAYVRAAVKELPERQYGTVTEVSGALSQIELGDAPYSADTDAPTPKPTGSS